MSSLTDKNQKVRIIPYMRKYASDFARLNYEWLTEFFEPEKHDREMLDHPQEYIINNGGEILFAQVVNEIAGTVALIEDGKAFELAKMSVSKRFRGQKIGNLLMTAAIAYSRQKNKEQLWLDSNTKLKPALHLYSKYGFKETSAPSCTPYSRCNIRMKLIL